MKNLRKPFVEVKEHTKNFQRMYEELSKNRRRSNKERTKNLQRTYEDLTKNVERSY